MGEESTDNTIRKRMYKLMPPLSKLERGQGERS